MHVLFRVILEYELLPFAPLIGDGNGDFGLLAPFTLDPPPAADFSDSHYFSFDEETYEYTRIDAPPPASPFSPSDPSILNQNRNNLTSASESEMFLRSGRDFKPEKKKPDPFKDPGSIGTHSSFRIPQLKLCCSL